MSHVDEGALHAYLDGELPASERAAVETHIAQCTECRARLVEERALRDRAGQVLGLAAPRELQTPSFEQIGQRQRARPSPWQVRLPVAWAASIALAIGLGYYLHAPELTVPTAASSEVAMEDRVSKQSPAPTEMARAEPKTSAARRPETRSKANAPPLPTTPAPTETVKTPVGSIRADSYLAAGRASASVAQAPSVAPRLEESDGGWPFASRDRARQILGTTPLGVLGLPVRAIRRDPTSGVGIVVEQEVDGATVIKVFQQRAEREKDRGVTARASNERLARFVGTLRVEIAGPLAQDSLNRLLEQVQPLP